MVAHNYRRFPEALLQQLELVFGHVLDTIEGIRIKGGAAWANLRARYVGAAPDVRTQKPSPAWCIAADSRARALSKAVKAACLRI